MTTLGWEADVDRAAAAAGRGAGLTRDSGAPVGEEQKMEEGHAQQERGSEQGQQDDSMRKDGVTGHQQQQQPHVDDKGLEDGEEEEAGPPFDPPFAPLRPPFHFWQDAVTLLLLGGALGALGYAYLKAITEVNDLWLHIDGNSAFPHDPATLRFGAGRAWWVALCGGTGLVVGAAKAILQLDATPGFITELRSMHVEPAAGLKAAAVGLLGLLGGAPMGPEGGLGAAAGAAGVVLGRLRILRLPARPAGPCTRRRVYVLSAMCSALASILPSPLSAILLVLELGRPAAGLGADLQYMHLLSLLAAGATASFCAYFAISGHVYLPVNTLLSVLPFIKYDQMFIIVGILFGVMGAAFALCYILIGGIVQALANAARRWLDARLGLRLRKVVMATVGGIILGALGWAMPLVLTDGSVQLGPIIHSARDIGSGVLAASAFAKALAYHVCAQCGWVGGLFLPMLTMSTMLGQVFANETGVSRSVATCCSLVALAGGLVPAPIMLCMLALSMLQLGPEGLVPLFATVVTSHLLCLGLGLPQALAAAGQRRQQGRQGGRSGRRVRSAASPPATDTAAAEAQQAPS